MSNATIKSFCFLVLPPEKNCPPPPNNCSPKSFSGGQKKTPFSESLLGAPKNSCHGFSNYYIHRKKFYSRPIWINEKLYRKKIRSLQHFTLKLVILVPFSKRDS